MFGLASKSNAGRHQKIRLGSCKNYISWWCATQWAVGRVRSPSLPLAAAAAVYLSDQQTGPHHPRGEPCSSEVHVLLSLHRLPSALLFPSLEKGTCTHRIAMGSHVHTQHADGHAPPCGCTFICLEAHAHTQDQACTLTGSHIPSLLDGP